MRNDTNLFSIFRIIYLNRERYLSSKEIAEKTQIPLKQITPYTNRLRDFLSKKKEGNQKYYKLLPSREEKALEIIQNST